MRAAAVIRQVTNASSLMSYLDVLMLIVVALVAYLNQMRSDLEDKLAEVNQAIEAAGLDKTPSVALIVRKQSGDASNASYELRLENCKDYDKKLCEKIRQKTMDKVLADEIADAVKTMLGGFCKAETKVKLGEKELGMTPKVQLLFEGNRALREVLKIYHAVTKTAQCRWKMGEKK